MSRFLGKLKIINIFKNFFYYLIIPTLFFIYNFSLLSILIFQLLIFQI